MCDLGVFLDGNDFSHDAVEKGRNEYYQKQLANQLTDQMNEILSLLTSAMSIHLNIGQRSTINTPNAYMSTETISAEGLLNKNIQQVGNAQIQLPSQVNSNFNGNSTLSLRVCLEDWSLFSIVFVFPLLVNIRTISSTGRFEIVIK